MAGGGGRVLFQSISPYSACALAATAGVICLTWFIKSMVTSRYRRRRLDEKLKDQSYVFDAKENIRTSPYTRDGPLIDKLMGNLSTLYEVFQHGLKIAKNKPCLGWRPTPDAPYRWITYAETYRRVCRLGSGLKTLEPANLKDICIGIYATNCVEWAVTQQACSTFGFVIVPLYDTLGEVARKYILEQTELSICVCDSATRVRNILEDTVTTGNWVKHIILIHPGGEFGVLRAEAEARNIKLHTFDEVLAMGKEDAQPGKLPQADDLHLICYTSGTTGRPKGVMITHRMVVSVISGFDMDLQEVNIKPGDYYLSFLPLAHVFEQIVMQYALGRGSAVGFFGGDLRRLSDDILALRPTLFVAVPRVLQRLYGTVQDAVANSFIKKWLLRTAVNAKMGYVREGIVTRDTFWDKYILKPIQDRMGGRLRFFACGSAPISAEVYSFCRAALGVHAYEAYGLTESCGAMIMTLPNDYVAGHAGTPLPCSMVKLIDVPDMDVIVSRDNAGEICVKGPSCTKGYYKDPERTAELIDADGWLHTGDIGQWTPRGALRLIDRCKNMFKLAQGEYVSPERVEMIYAQSHLVNQIFLDGNSRESFAIAICVPNMKALREAMCLNTNGSLANGLINGALRKVKECEISDEELCAKKEACLTVLKDLVRLGKEAGLKGFEQAKSIYLTSHEFTIESGLMTPTQKKLRSAFRRTFKEEINRLYQKQMIL
uniref:long-chain-fatty-acid--CoA ligase n=1 Tax=Echinococcus granulosus TaxID=6210 RepID=A0A068WHE3_ECHGR|nr:long chain fatty acid coenzyme A ligase 5 [Echinococcus granulosus]